MQRRSGGGDRRRGAVIIPGVAAGAAGRQAKDLALDETLARRRPLLLRRRRRRRRQVVAARHGRRDAADAVAAARVSKDLRRIKVAKLTFDPTDSQSISLPFHSFVQKKQQRERTTFQGKKKCPLIALIPQGTREGGGGEGPPYWLARLICIKRKESPSYRRGGRAGTALLAGATHLHKTRRENGVDQWPDAGRRPIRNRRPKKKSTKKSHRSHGAAIRRLPSPVRTFLFIFFFKHSFNFFFLIRTVGHRSQKNRRRGRSRGHLSNFSSPFTKRCAKKKDDNQTGEN